MIPRAEPEVAIAVLEDRPDLLVAQAFGHCVVQECPIAPVAQAVVGSDPYAILAIFHQSARTEIRQPVADPEILHVLLANPAHALIGRNPHGSVVRLHEASYEVINQPSWSRVADSPGRSKPVRAAAVRANPQCS